MSIPYYLLSKRTQLPEGHDDTLDPPEPPTDPARRTVSLLDWLRVDTSKGPAGPPDAPLAPPAVDPARRTVPAFDWPRGLPGRIANRSVREFLPLQLITLDPDIALWQTVPVSIWPFEGPPEEGSWPRGWFGIDNTAQPYVCTVAGEPGTWAPIGFSSAGVASFTSHRATASQSQTRLGRRSTSADARGEILPPCRRDLHATGVGAAASLATFLTTASLAVGTWLITFNGTVQTGSQAGGAIQACASDVDRPAADIWPKLHFNRTSSGKTSRGSTEADRLLTASLSFIATVTTAGTLVFQAITTSADTVTIEATTPQDTYPNATGYTAVKIA